ncbi:hypothetical protein [Corynebacterium guangdongense]|uniref:Uncharacterized protein n=1 Tax=Corynebacterium guangdongense TaxID=1783348 RepID=A0ABU2A0U8_9CORY|nr:hypothetical protein [Corynebacterium guangdongense]MDR7330809.1 hypothetical protein [Corynebacterium guangdongense]
MTLLLIAIVPLILALFAILMEKLESGALRRSFEPSAESLPVTDTEEGDQDAS